MTPKQSNGLFKSISDTVYKHMENGSGNMILLTSMAAMILSTLAQTGAILTNKKYSPTQKAFMVPQEITEGCISVLSMFFITKPIQKMSDLYVKKGKILTNDMQLYMKKHNLLNKRGKPNFNLEETINNRINKIKNAKLYTNSDINKQNMLKEENEMLTKYYSIYDTTSAIATTAGGILSTAIFSPVLRNYSASYFQKKNTEAYKNYYQILNQNPHANKLKIN